MTIKIKQYENLPDILSLQQAADFFWNISSAGLRVLPTVP